MADRDRGSPHVLAPGQWRLSEVDIFCDLPPQDMERISASAPMREVPAGTLLLRPGQGNEVLFILKRGRVRLYRVTADGRTLTLSIVDKGDIFGEMQLLGQSLQETYAETLEPSVVCIMSKDDVYRLLLADARVSARIVTALGHRVTDLERRLEQAVFRTVPSRVASTLVALAGSDRGADVRLTHEQLADLVGTTRETTTKVLGDLRDRGLVDLRRGRIRVRDIAVLRALADDPSWSASTGGHTSRTA
ncbi:MAG: Crp/Fnr family transcriptional regulator [Candidatus Nanopelagicales bacterium]